MTKTEQIVKQALRLACEAAEAEAVSTDDVFRATRAFSTRGVRWHSVARALEAAEARGEVERLTVEGMAGQLTYWKENS